MEANKRQYHYNNSRTGNTSGTGYASGRSYQTGTGYASGRGNQAGTDYASGRSYQTGTGYASGRGNQAGTDYASGRRNQTGTSYASGRGNHTGTSYASGRGYAGASYIDGNTVRKLEAAPDIRRKEQPAVAPSPQRQVHRQPKSLSGINFASLLVLTAAIIATLYLCVDYLKLQNVVNRLDKEIVTLEDKLTVLTKENDAAYNLVNESYDLDYVYRVAVEELGMVYPNNNTVITYESNASGFVRQFEDIPK